MEKFIALETRKISAMGRPLEIIEGKEYNESIFTQSFPKYFRSLGKLTDPAPLTVPELINEVVPEVAPITEQKEELLLDDSSDVKIVIEEEQGGGNIPPVEVTTKAVKKTTKK